jgi:hypothetical protein
VLQAGEKELPKAIAQAMIPQSMLPLSAPHCFGLMSPLPNQTPTR